MKAILPEGKSEAGANHLPTETENDTVVHWRVSILTSATCEITNASQPRETENDENSHTDNSTTHRNDLNGDYLN